MAMTIGPIAFGFILYGVDEAQNPVPLRRGQNSDSIFVGKINLGWFSFMADITLFCFFVYNGINLL
jgi:hypothetical protein